MTPTRPRLPVWRTRRRGVGPGQAGCGSQQRSNRFAHCVPGVRVRVSDNNNSLVLLLFFLHFHPFVAKDVWPVDVWCLHVASELIGGYKRRAWNWSRIDYWSDCSRDGAESLAKCFFLCGCAATLWTQNVVQDWSWFKTSFLLAP